MFSFKEFSALLSEQKKSQQGTHIMAELSTSSRDQLFNFVNTLDIPNTTDPNEYHSTIISSRKSVDASDYKFDKKIEATITEWKILPTKTGKSCLVAIVDSKKLVKYNSDLMTDYGATSDFPSYHPHITISYDLEAGTIPKEIPLFKITYDKVTIKPLDLDFVPKTVD